MKPESEISGLRVQRHVDPDTGDLSIDFSFDGKPFPVIPIEGAVAERFSGLTLISKDLHNALGWAEEAATLMDGLRQPGSGSVIRVEDRVTGDRVKALFVAALTFYAKAYTEAAGRRAQMSRDWLDAEFRDRHDFFMSYRHNLAAHSGDEKYEEAESYILLVPAGHRGFNFRLFTNRKQPDFVHASDLQQTFPSLIEHAIAKVEAKYEKMGERLLTNASKMDGRFWRIAGASGAPLDVTKLMRGKKK